MKAVLVVLGVIAAIAVLGGGCALQGYNQIVTLDEGVKNKWGQIDVDLQRRYDLIPNLVASVKGMTEQEQKIFISLAEARKGYFAANTVNEKAEAANRVESALSRLLVFSENYPQLKSNEMFLKLMDSLEGTENRIKVSRMDYNNAVETLNSTIRRFPGQFFAGLAGVQAATYFKTDEAAREAPKVDFSEKKAPPVETSPAPTAPAETPK